MQGDRTGFQLSLPATFFSLQPCSPLHCTVPFNLRVFQPQVLPCAVLVQMKQGQARKGPSVAQTLQPVRRKCKCWREVQHALTPSPAHALLECALLHAPLSLNTSQPHSLIKNSMMHMTRVQREAVVQLKSDALSRLQISQNMLCKPIIYGIAAFWQ